MTELELLTLQLELLEQIAFDLRVILVFTVLTFVTAAFRSWRKTVTEGFN